MSDKSTCPHCAADIRATDQFCSSCGNKIKVSAVPESSAEPAKASVVCGSCGVSNPASNVRCFSCGWELVRTHDAAPRVQRSEKKSSGSGTAKKPSWLNSLSNQILLAFGVFIAIIVLVEMQNRPVETVQAPVQQPSQASPSTAPTREVLDQIAAQEKIIAADPKDAGAMLQLANLLHDARFYPRAIEMYKKYLVLRPKEPDAIVDLGICYFETGDADKAVKVITSAIAIDPKHQMAMFNLGIILLNENKTDESKKWLQRCIDIDPQSVAGQRARDILHQH